MKLSDSTIEKMILSKKHMGEFHKDDLLSQLHVKFNLNGASWHFIGTLDNGNRVRKVLGKYPAIDLKGARELVRAVMIEQSTNAIKKAKPLPTFGEVLTLYIEYRKPKAITAKDYRAILERFRYSDKRIDITADQFTKDYQAIYSNTPTQARVLARLIKSLQRWASVHYDRPIDDATRKIKTLTGESITKVNARDRRLEKNQIDDFLRVLDETTELQRDAVIFALLTGVRFGELRQITANSIINREGMQIITIADTKNGTPQNLPMVGKALEIIERRLKATTKAGGALFPTEAKPFFAKLKDSGIPLSWHDLRRSWASFAVNNGISEQVIKRVLNHIANSDITSKHYVRVDMATIAQALMTVENVIFSAE